MKFNEIHNFEDIGWIDRAVSVLRVISTFDEHYKVPFIITMIVIFTTFLFIALRPLGNWKKNLLYIPIMFVVEVIAIFIYLLIISQMNLGTGYYEKNIKPQHVKATSNIDGSYTTKVEIQDEDNEKLILEYKGEKPKKKDKVQVRTNEKLVKGDDSKRIKFDLSSDNRYKYFYKGKEIKSNDIRQMKRGLFSFSH